MISRFYFKYSIKDFILEFCYNIDKIMPDISAFTEYFKVNHIVFAEKGRVSLCLALQSLGLPHGSTIGVQPFTCSSVFLAIRKAGFQLLFIDLDNNLRLSHEDLRSKAGIIDALVVTHTFGFPEDVNAFRSIIGNKPVIEDCAQAFFSEYNGKSVGTIGDAGIFSTGYAKFLGIGTGGFVVSSNPKIMEKIEKNAASLKHSSWYIFFKRNIENMFLYLLHFPILYSLITFPAKRIMKPKVVKLQKYPIVERTLHESGIMLLASKFLKYQELVIQQRKNGKLLSDLLMGKHFVIIPLQGSNPNYFLVPLRCKNRDSVIRHLISKGIEAGRHFSDSIHWVKGFGYIEGSCPVFEQITKDILTVPCHYFLDSRKIEYIAKTLNQYNDK